MSSAAPTCVDAFSGAGGLSLGLQEAGFELLLGFDIDPLSVATQRANERYVRHAVIEADIRQLLGGVILPHIGLAKGELDLLSGGPPCQGFSVQRTFGGDDDERNLLVHDYGDLVLELRPKFFLMENVVGMGGARGRLILSQFLERMSLGGYFVHKKTLDAQEYGVPQRRRRLIVVGERHDGLVPLFAWPSPVREEDRRCVRHAIGHLPPPPLDGSDHPDFPMHRRDRLSEKNKLRLQALSEGQGRIDLPDELLADCHRVSADVVGHRRVYGRMRWDEVAPTITARFDSFTRGQFGHPTETRSVSLLEGALLQTFPKDYDFRGTKVDIARQIGNAVPPQLGFRLGLSIRQALKGRMTLDAQ